MSDPRLDALAETARNRGLKLVRSRVRTAGKRRFGKVGLTTPAGKAVFGMDGKGPTAKPEEVEEYLRNLGAKDWGESLGVAVMPRKRKRTAKPTRDPANDPEPAPRAAKQPKPDAEPEPPPPPKPKVRAAKPADAKALVQLMRLLDHGTDEKGLKKRLSVLTKQKLPPLVATLDKQVVGLVGLHRMVTIHRDKPVGRITILVVGEAAREHGIGRMLVAAAEKELRKLGCGMVEVTSNDRLSRAHAFYRHLGYERTSMRFMKKL